MIVLLRQLPVLILSLFSLCAVASEPSSQGISFSASRIIYMEEDRNGVTLEIQNNNAAPYLLQSWIVHSVQSETMLDISPFIVTPPLSRIEPDSALSLRIRRNAQALPDDRESVFFISIRAIPTSDAIKETDQLIITVTSKMKIFYRPQELARRAIADIRGQLRFRLQKGELIAQNPTPYWLTFSELRLGGRAVSEVALRQMVPPYGEMRYPVTGATTGVISWRLVDEDGWETPPERRTL